MTKDQSLVAPGNGQAVTRQEFGASQIAPVVETAATAVAARAQAEVQARYIVALQRPRNLAQVRVCVLEHCKRPRFAEKALYSKPVGREKIVGPSIRFVEAALQEYGNCQPDSSLVYEDDKKLICKVTVTDYERNITHGVDITVHKTVERKFLREGQQPLSQRVNSYGDTVYLVPATDDQVANSKAAAESKAIRNLGLRILPADIVEEAKEQIEKTMQSGAAADPGRERKAIADGFFALGIKPTALEEYLGHPIDQTTPAELVELRTVYTTLSDGEATWADALEFRLHERGEAPEEKKAGKGASALKSRLQAKKAKAPAKDKKKETAERPAEDPPPADDVGDQPEWA